MEKPQDKAKREEAEKNVKELTPEEIEKQNEVELNNEILAQQKLQKKKERKQREIQKKRNYIQKMSIMTGVNPNNNESNI